jgi:uncharacterized protein (TIGR02217 family)
MSSFLFPYTLPGIKFDYLRAYVWHTGVQKALSGKQSTIAYQLYPMVRFEYAFDHLLDSNIPADISAMVGLFNAVQGRFDTFLHTDPDFNTITSANAAQYGRFGTGDGSTLVFQLLALYQNSGGPGQAEIIQNLNGTPILYDNGSVISAANYTIGPTGIVTFGAGHAPANTHALTWSGSWYYRCRFDADTYDFKKFMKSLWSIDKITFTSVLL